MKNILLIVLVILCVTSYAQQVRVVKSENDNQILAKTLWGNDIQISDRELVGKMDGIQTSDGTIYVAINDVIPGTGTGLNIRKSTNNGLTWSVHHLAVTPDIKYDNLRIIKGRLDSIYVFYQYGDHLTIWNILATSLRSVTIPNLRSWDAAATSTGNFYLFFEVDNVISRQASTDCGVTWIDRRLSTTGANPKLTKSIANDNLYLICYSSSTSEISKRAIPLLIYNEISSGILGISHIYSAIPDGQDKTEIGIAVNQDRLWIVYTVSTGSNIDIVGRYSNDQGATFSGEVNIAVDPYVDEYWFDVKANIFGPTDFDLIYYSDFLQPGTANNATDNICATISYTEVFSNPLGISHNYPYWSPNEFVPRIIELPFTSRGDFGAVWVGYTGTNSGLFWNNYNSTTSVKNLNVVPTDFQLNQNYPNPFNPSTKISYQLPIGCFVTLKVYDILGKEIATLVNEYKQAGKHEVEFGTSHLEQSRELPSGVYFYSIKSGAFIQTKKMILIK